MNKAEQNTGPSRPAIAVNNVIAGNLNPTLYALPIWLAYAALAPIAIYSFVNLVVLLIVCAFGAHGWAAVQKTIVNIYSLFGAPLIALCVLWFVAASLWAPQPEDAIWKLARLVILGGVLIAALSGIRNLSAQHTKVLQSVIAATTVLMLIIYIIEALFGFPIAQTLKEIDVSYLGDDAKGRLLEIYREQRANSSISRGMVALGALSFSVAYIVWQRTRNIYLVLFWLLMSLLVASTSRMQAVTVAMIGSAGAAAWIWFFPRHGLRHLAIGMVSFLLLFPFTASQLLDPGRFGIEDENLPYSTQHRIQIYQHTSSLIIEQPLSGFGFDVSRRLSDEAPRFLPANHPPHAASTASNLPLHPHNLSLQIWLESGFVGIALLSACFLLLADRVSGSQIDKEQRLLVAATGAFLFVIASLSFGIWQFHWLSLIGLSTGAVLACCSQPTNKV